MSKKIAVEERPVEVNEVMAVIQSALEKKQALAKVHELELAKAQAAHDAAVKATMPQKALASTNERKQAIYDLYTAVVRYAEALTGNIANVAPYENTVLSKYGVAIDAFGYTDVVNGNLTKLLLHYMCGSVSDKAHKTDNALQAERKVKSISALRNYVKAFGIHKAETLTYKREEDPSEQSKARQEARAEKARLQAAKDALCARLMAGKIDDDTFKVEYGKLNVESAIAG